MLTGLLASGVVLWLWILSATRDRSSAAPSQVGGAPNPAPPLMPSDADLSPAEAKTQPSPKSPQQAPLPQSEGKIDEDGFVGSEACASCHQAQYQPWSQSTHGQAGGRPEEVRLVAAFDGKPLEFEDAVVRPRRLEGGGYGFEVEPLGGQPFTIEVDAVVGGGHMYGGGTQSFFNEFPDGTLRFLPFDFIRKENHWFVQLQSNKHWVPVSREIALARDLANWPPHRVLGSSLEFSNCQNCHGSQLNLRYDPADKRYQTRFTTLRINCESCHGPGRRHVELAGRPDAHELADLGMEPLATRTRDASLQVCFQCHALKDQLREEAFLPGRDLEDYYSLKLPMFGDRPYLADGRVSSFGYQLNHLFSDCYRNGSMTCVDCHDPHGQGYRDVWGRALAGKFDDGQCTSCHPSKAADPERHTHHAPGTPGSRCVDCHMPFLQHPGVGDQLVFSRSDHTIPIPRPQFDQELGVENACQKCHGDRDIAWQEEAVRNWYGILKPHPERVAGLLRARSLTNIVEAAAALLDPDPNHPMGQMAGLAAFLEAHLRPDMERWDLQVGNRLLALSRMEDPDVQALALMALQVVYGNHPQARSRVDEALEAARDETQEKVRRRWSVAADRWGGQYLARGELAEAILCFEKSWIVMPDNVVTLTHLAQAYEKGARLEDALEAQQKAVSLQPQRGTLHFQLARIHYAKGEISRAMAALEEGLKFAPEDARARSMLEYLRAQ